MSWSVYLDSVPVEDFGEALAKAAESPSGHVIDESKEQIALAVEIAKQIVASGAIGSGPKFGGALSGHANEGHKPAAGYANDMIAVTISRRD